MKNFLQKITITLICLLIAGTVIAQSPSGRTPTVLIFNSYHKGFNWTDDLVSAATRTLSPKIKDLELYVEYMDTKRAYKDDYIQLIRQTMQFKYDNIKLDAIISTDDNALQFLLKYGDEIFGETPVVFCGVNNFQNSMLQGKTNFTGLLEALEFKSTIDLALKLHPQSRRVVVITDNTTTGFAQNRTIAAVASEYKDLKFEYLSGRELSTGELVEKLKALPAESIVLLSTWSRDKTGTYYHFDKEYTDTLISSSSTAPIYSATNAFWGSGVVGGKLLDGNTHGSRAAKVVLRILNGQKPSAIPVSTEADNSYIFDYNQLKHWQINMADLPEGSIIINEPQSFYYTYKTQIWMVAIAIAALAAVILILSANLLYRRQAGKALKESDELYRSLADVLPQNMYRADKNGRIIYANKAYLAGLEVAADECLGKTHYDFFPQEMADKYTADDNRVMQTGQILDTVESHRVPASGEMIYVQMLKMPIRNSKGDICGIQGIFWDVTKQKHVEAELTEQVEKLAMTQESLLNIMDDTERAKNELEQLNKELKAEIEQRERAEKALRDSEQRYALAQRTANIGTWESNLETGKVTWVGQIHKIFGLEPEQFKGTEQTYYELVHPDDRQHAAEAVRACLETPGKTYDIEHRIVWPDGTLRWVSQVADVFRDEDDKPVRMLGITMDITERKEAEQKLEQTVLELKRSNADLQQFAHVASHDLQEPLRMITSYMQLLVKRYGDRLDADAKEFIDFAADGAKRMQGLIKDLLCYSRVGSHGRPFIFCDGAEIITKSIRDLSKLIEENNAEVTHDPMPMLMADEGQIEQLFRNLITNAIRYRSKDRAPEIHIGCEEKDNEWQFFVRDNGVGIESQYFERIFIIFQQLHDKSEYGGSGIGLSLCKRIIERHGGKIWVESKPQKGSTFYFTILQKKHLIRPSEKIEQPTAGKSA